MRWHYNTTDLFFKRYYDKLLTENMIAGGEMYIEEAKDNDGSPITLSKFYFPLKKDKFIYLIPSKDINNLPVLIEKCEKISYSSKGYMLPKKLIPMRIKPEMKMSFRELVDSFATSEHSNPDHNLFWRLITIVSFVDRINVRVATSPEFGKDSKLNLLNSLTGVIGKVSNPTIAKLEYLLFNKIILINEVSGINSQSKQDVEQFILACGDFNNEYNKRSRASAGSSEKYDINNLSLVIAYNDLSNYTNTEKYFDFMWTNAGAINNRILPFLLQGKTTQDFSKVFNIDDAVKDNWNFYVNFIRALLYFQNNKQQNYKWDNNIKVDFGGSGRWKSNFTTIMKWLSLYCESQEEYDKMVKELYQCHLNYTKSLHGNRDAYETEVVEEDMSERDFEKLVVSYLEKYDGDKKGIDITTILNALQIEESELSKLKVMGIIFEPKAGFIALL